MAGEPIRRKLSDRSVEHYRTRLAAFCGGEVPGKVRLVSHKPAFTAAPGFAATIAQNENFWMLPLKIGCTASRSRIPLERFAPRWRTSIADRSLPRDPFSPGKQTGWMDRLPDQELVLADMGCGKGYLTFGAWHLFNRVLKRPARVIGVEARADLAAKTRQLASVSVLESIFHRRDHSIRAFAQTRCVNCPARLQYRHR